MLALYFFFEFYCSSLSLLFGVFFLFGCLVLCSCFSGEGKLAHLGHSTPTIDTGPERQIRGSIVVSISARHAEDPGSIPGRGVFAMQGYDGLSPGSMADRWARGSAFASPLPCLALPGLVWPCPRLASLALALFRFTAIHVAVP